MNITPETIARQPPEAQQMILYLLGRVRAAECGNGRAVGDDAGQLALSSQSLFVGIGFLTALDFE